jgi:UDP-N-acetylmuramoyl-tripeptide--D-alanyl-D-alanine ligase
MKQVNIEDLLQASGGVLNREFKLNGNRLEIDSRRTDETSIFFPVLGEIHDGHKFILGALEKAPSSFCEKSHYYANYNQLKDKNLILVDNTTKALHRITKYILKKSGVKVVGITGSVGKTSTKEFAYHVLSEHYQVHKNKGNFNNHIGMPLTVLDMPEGAEIAVLEMGMNHFKEIETLVEIARPQVAVIGNIGTSHIGILGSKENIFKAKLEITTYLDQDQVLILNGLDDYLKDVDSNAFRVIKVGTEYLGFEQVTLQDNGCYGYQLIFEGKRYPVNLNVLGEHNVINSLLAIQVGLELGVSIEACIRGAEKYKDSNKRLELYDSKYGLVINDCYNASEESMISAINVTIERSEKEKIIVLGDVLELGDYAKESHEHVGDFIANKAVTTLYTYGKDAKYISDKALEKGANYCIKHFTQQDELINRLKKEEKDRVILIKGSQGMKMQNIVDALTK